MKYHFTIVQKEDVDKPLPFDAHIPTWIDWETDGVVAGGVELEAVHNARGAEINGTCETGVSAV